MATTEDEIKYDVHLIIDCFDYKRFTFLFSNVSLDFLSSERFKREYASVCEIYNDGKVNILLCPKNLKK